MITGAGNGYSFVTHCSATRSSSRRRIRVVVLRPTVKRAGSWSESECRPVGSRHSKENCTMLVRPLPSVGRCGAQKFQSIPLAAVSQIYLKPNRVTHSSYDALPESSNAKLPARSREPWNFPAKSSCLHGRLARRTDSGGNGFSSRTATAASELRY